MDLYFPPGIIIGNLCIPLSLCRFSFCFLPDQFCVMAFHIPYLHLYFFFSIYTYVFQFSLPVNSLWRCPFVQFRDVLLLLKTFSSLSLLHVNLHICFRRNLRNCSRPQLSILFSLLFLSLTYNLIVCFQHVGKQPKIIFVHTYSFFSFFLVMALYSLHSHSFFLNRNKTIITLLYYVEKFEKVVFVCL